MDLPSPPALMTPPVACLTSEQTRSCRCTPTIILSVGLLRWPSPGQAGSCWPATMISTATCGTPWRRRGLECWLDTTTECPVSGSLRTVSSRPPSTSGVNNIYLCRHGCLYRLLGQLLEGNHNHSFCLTSTWHQPVFTGLELRTSLGSRRLWRGGRFLPLLLNRNICGEGKH